MMHTEEHFLKASSIEFHLENDDNNAAAAAAASSSQEQEEKPPAAAAVAASTKQIAEYAEERMKEIEESPQVQKLENKRRSIPEIQQSQIQIGKLLGEGTFASVHAIKSTKSSIISTKHHVIKLLRQKTIKSSTASPNAVVAIARTSTVAIEKETLILSTLTPHPNIIQIIATSQNGISAFKESSSRDVYFIVLERISHTLAQQIKRYKSKVPSITALRLKSIFSCFASPKKRLHLRLHQRQKLFQQRLRLGLQLASAICHLHRSNIMHRDLKPDNVGIDFEGNVKLFDFDVSHVLPNSSHDVVFPLKPRVGSTRFMAPEVALGPDYNIAADVYSFAMVLYHLLSLKAPFANFTRAEMLDKVFHGGERPYITHTWPLSLNHLVTKCWATDASNRPEMQKVHDSLSDILQELEKSLRKESSTKHFAKSVRVSVDKENQDYIDTSNKNTNVSLFHILASSNTSATTSAIIT